jgi:hypothetical protein
MPLSFCSASDRVAWPLTKTGTFTVKSACVMEKCKEVHLKISKQGRGEFSNQIQIAKEWKKLWSISAPPKTLIILWRFAHDCFPTGQQMK